MLILVAIVSRCLQTDFDAVQSSTGLTYLMQCLVDVERSVQSQELSTMASRGSDDGGSSELLKLMLLEAEHGVLPSTSGGSVGGGKRLGDTILYGCTMDSKSACVRLVKPFLPYFWFPGLTTPRQCVCVHPIGDSLTTIPFMPQTYSAPIGVESGQSCATNATLSALRKVGADQRDLGAELPS